MNGHLAILRDRAAMLAKARSFFAERYVLEVDCPLLTFGASFDAHIDLISALYAESQVCYLISSPEYCMKRLLSKGIGAIYQLGHVFRDGEISRKHNPEFTMAEWYRVNFSFDQLIAETCDFMRLFLGHLPHTIISYREAFQKYAGIDYLTVTDAELLQFIKSREIPPYPGIEKEGKNALLNLILGVLIEPQLGAEGLCALAYYPASQAALAKTRHFGEEAVAERFEVYYRGVELCNGYHELTDPVEQRKRFIEANKERVQLGKKPLPIDEEFLKALEKGMPDSCGVAVGFDRLMMLRHNVNEITDVIPIPWTLTTTSQSGNREIIDRVQRPAQ
jgi:elongation factor P--(R)-beta-lysine ligase